MSILRSALWVLAAVLTGCSSWQRAETFEGWSLYAEPGAELDVSTWREVFDPALAAVELDLGPFQGPVRVHAWQGAVELAEDGRHIRHTHGEGVQNVPGIGLARVQGYHARGGFGPFGRGGVFLGEPDPGTAVHELVHARLAEEPETLPLWFEEGIASWFGDGVLFEGRWTVDGFACWPWRELRSNRLTDGELAALLDLRPSDTTNVRDNVLVHFVGWAVVFDLALETGSRDWRVWRDTFDWSNAVRDARVRLDRTLETETPVRWIERLRSEDPAQRFATARGTWKLASLPVAEALIAALGRERDPEVQVAMAINLLAVANDMDLAGPTTWRVRRAAQAALRRADLENPSEQEAVESLFVFRSPLTENRLSPLESLRRFWAE